tara:strand:- start:136 stop:762 length:627 start_codon:yes stop_codon:yes gene_type:complete
MAKKPIVQRDPDNNILNPDADYIRLITGIVKERAKEKTQKTNLFTGKVKYRVVGDRTFGLNQNEDKNIAGFDVMHPSADPFRDPDVDKERVNSKGVVDRDTIADSNVVFVYSEDLYHSLYSSEVEDTEAILATFLLRVRYDKKKFTRLSNTKDSHVEFSFKDRQNLRDPVIEESKGSKQDLTEEQPAKSADVTPSQGTLGAAPETAIA